MDGTRMATREEKISSGDLIKYFTELKKTRAQLNTQLNLTLIERRQIDDNTCKTGGILCKKVV